MRRELVAGKPAGWIRPVSDRQHEEVSECECEKGEAPRLLDAIDVPVLEPRPKTFQRENWLLDPGCYWSKLARLTPQDLSSYFDDGPRWVNVRTGLTHLTARQDRCPRWSAGSVRRLGEVLNPVATVESVLGRRPLQITHEPAMHRVGKRSSARSW